MLSYTENSDIEVLNKKLRIIEEKLKKNQLSTVLITQEKLKNQQDKYTNASRIAKTYQADLKKQLEVERDIKVLEKTRVFE